MLISLIRTHRIFKHRRKNSSISPLASVAAICVASYAQCTYSRARMCPPNPMLAAVNVVSSHHEESRGARGLPSQVGVFGRKTKANKVGSRCTTGSRWNRTQITQCAVKREALAPEVEEVARAPPPPRAPPVPPPPPPPLLTSEELSHWRNQAALLWQPRQCRCAAWFSDRIRYCLPLRGRPGVDLQGASMRSH